MSMDRKVDDGDEEDEKDEGSNDDSDDEVEYVSHVETSYAWITFQSSLVETLFNNW